MHNKEFFFLFNIRLLKLSASHLNIPSYVENAAAMIVSRKVLLQYTTLLLYCIQNLDRSKVICKRLYESLAPYIKEPVPFS